MQPYVLTLRLTSAPDGDEEDEDEEGSEGQEQGVASGPAGGIDFFGLGGSSTSKASAKPANAAPARTAAALTAPSSITTKPAVPASNKVSTSSVKISAAPTTVAPELSSNYYATLPLPTPGDPYPGFYKKPDGTWAAKRPEEWASYMEAMNEWNTANQEAQGQAAKETEEPELPKDFEQVGIERSVEVRAAELRKAAGFDPTKPDLISDEEKKRIEEEKMRAKVSFQQESTCHPRSISDGHPSLLLSLYAGQPEEGIIRRTVEASALDPHPGCTGQSAGARGPYRPAQVKQAHGRIKVRLLIERHPPIFSIASSSLSSSTTSRHVVVLLTLEHPGGAWQLARTASLSRALAPPLAPKSISNSPRGFSCVRL